MVTRNDKLRKTPTVVGIIRLCSRQFVKDEVYIHCMDARIQKEKNSNGGYLILPGDVPSNIFGNFYN